MKKQNLFLLVLVFLFALGLPITCLAAEPQTITMSIQDYNSLKSNYLTLKQNNEKQATLLKTLKEQLDILKEQQGESTQDWLLLRIQLTEAQDEAKLLKSQLAVLQRQLDNAMQSSKAAEQSLQSANQSLSELNKAIKKERQAAETRETVLKVIAGGAIIYALSHK